MLPEPRGFSKDTYEIFLMYFLCIMLDTYPAIDFHNNSNPAQSILIICIRIRQISSADPDSLGKMEQIRVNRDMVTA